MTSAKMPSAYNAADVEQRIYQDWQSNGYFHATIEKGQEPYVIIMPPPNVTGELHLGHALEKAIEDALVRWRCNRSGAGAGGHLDLLGSRVPRLHT